MKKLIAILTIAIVLVGAVFADTETHGIKVRAQVGETLPSFQLSFSTFKTNANENVFGTQNYAAQADGSALDIGFDLAAEDSAVFSLYLANKAKTNRVFTVTFSDGVFDVSRNGSGVVADHAGQTYGPSSITTAVANGQAAVVDAEANNAAIYEVALGNAQDATNKPITITFHGRTVKTEDVVLATATYAYLGDDSIDPTTTETPYYYATVTMTVTTE